MKNQRIRVLLVNHSPTWPIKQHSTNSKSRNQIGSPHKQVIFFLGRRPRWIIIHCKSWRLQGRDRTVASRVERWFPTSGIQRSLGLPIVFISSFRRRKPGPKQKAWGNQRHLRNASSTSTTPREKHSKHLWSLGGKKLILFDIARKANGSPMDHQQACVVDSKQ